MSEEIKTDNNQKSETFAVKLDLDIKERLQQLIKDNKGDGTQGSVIEAMINFYELNNATNYNLDFKGDLKALHQATSRIYNIYSSMIEKVNINVEDMETTSNKQLEEKQQQIDKLKSSVLESKESDKLNKKKIDDLIGEKWDIEKEIREIRNQLYDKNKLSGMLEREIEDLKQYKSNSKALEEENKVLETDLGTLKNTNIQLESTIVGNKQEIDNLKGKLLDMENKYKEEVQSVKVKLELEKQQAILKIQQDHQLQMQELQNQKMKEVTEYQDRYNKLLDKTDLEKEDL